MNNQYILPITILCAGLVIAGAVFFAGKSTTTTPNTNGGKVSIRPYDPKIDHVLGNPNAPIKVIEYADLECPYCKTFHNTMHQVMENYAKGGKVAWIYRPFPLAQLHSKAPKEAEAAECAAAQGGDAAFFRFIDRVYEVSPLSNGLDLAQLPVIAKDVGLDVTKFNQCLASGQFTDRVKDSYAEAIKAGGQGTPFVLITLGSDSIPLSGAQPYNSMVAAIDAVIAQLPAETGTSTPSN